MSTMLAVSGAWRWCGIISWAKVTSASLKSADESNSGHRSHKRQGDRGSDDGCGLGRSVAVFCGRSVAVVGARRLAIA